MYTFEPTDELKDALVRENEEMKEDLRVMKEAFEVASKLIQQFAETIPLTIEERRVVDGFTTKYAKRFPDNERDDVGQFGKAVEEWLADQPAKKTNNTPEPPPKFSGYPAVWDVFFRICPAPIPEQMARDIVQRDGDGAKKYGTRLKPFNGREAVVDAYQENLDLIAYLTQLYTELEIRIRDSAGTTVTQRARLIELRSRVSTMIKITTDLAVSILRLKKSVDR